MTQNDYTRYIRHARWISALGIGLAYVGPSRGGSAFARPGRSGDSESSRVTRISMYETSVGNNDIRVISLGDPYRARNGLKISGSCLQGILILTRVYPGDCRRPADLIRRKQVKKIQKGM